MDEEGSNTFTSLNSQVICILMQKYPNVNDVGQRLCSISKGLMIEVGRALLMKQLISPHKRNKHPLCFLQETEPKKVPLCIRWAIAFGENIIPPLSVIEQHRSPILSPRGFVDFYKQGLRSRIALAREVNPMCPFTFHLVTRWIITPGDPRTSSTFHEKASKTGGELEVHKFICIKNASEALLFFQRWAKVQRLNHGPQAMCLMECGPSIDGMMRKWIIDLDGKLEDLRSFGFLKSDEFCHEEQKSQLHKQVIAFGSAVSNALHTACHFLNAPCYFAIKSRHKTKQGMPGYSMLSWHMTLLAMAPYDDWRRAMQHIEAHVYPKQQKREASHTHMQISLLSDLHITRNSKGQFIQTLSSEKVEAGIPATGRRFELDGIYSPDGTPINMSLIPEREAISFMATSMMLPDPWSRFADLDTFHKHLPPEDSLVEGSQLKKRKPPPLPNHSKKIKIDGDEEGADEEVTEMKKRKTTSTTTSTDKATWDALPSSDSKWIRGLLDGGSTCTLGAIACMKDEKLMPMQVSNLLISGRAEIKFYAYITHNLLCPRHLLFGNKVYRHSNNDKLGAVCITEKLEIEGKQVQCVRLFCRCFSVKCLQEYQRHSTTSINWLELTEAHHLRYKRLKSKETKQKKEVDASTKVKETKQKKEVDTSTKMSDP